MSEIRLDSYKLSDDCEAHDSHMLPAVKKYSCHDHIWQEFQGTSLEEDSSWSGCETKGMSIVTYLLNRWDFEPLLTVRNPAYTHTLPTLSTLFWAPTTTGRAAVLTSAGLGIRWCSAKGLVATGSSWHRHRNFHYNDLGCGVPGMHPRCEGERYTERESKRVVGKEGGGNDAGVTFLTHPLSVM